MTPIYQDKIDNCFQACVASILNLSLNDVPHFQKDVMKSSDHRWTQERWNAVVKFGEDNGYNVFWLDPDIESDGILIDRVHNSELFYLATGNSPLGRFGHCVVYYKGRIIHDPLKNGNGLQGEPWLYIIFESKNLST